MKHCFIDHRLSSAGILCILFIVLPLHAGPAGAADTTKDTIITDTVVMCPVDSFVTAKDTGASAKKIEWRLGSVSMYHRLHESAKIQCIVCHHRKNNDDRIKRCATCHKGLAGMERLHNKCGQCHMSRNMSTSCDKCHSTAEGKPQAELLRFKFSHQNHYSRKQDRKQDCRFCHSEPLKAAWLKADNYPAMKTCLSCHDNRKSSGECSVCHNDVGLIKPKSHTPMWVGRYGHGLDANYNKAECMQCHRKTECDRCHLGQTSCRIHPPAYRFIHGMDVRMGLVNCAMCHDTKHACSRCHENRR